MFYCFLHIEVAYCFLRTICMTRYIQDNMKLSDHPLCVLCFALGLIHGAQHGANTP